LAWASIVVQAAFRKSGFWCGLASLAIYARVWRILLTPENFIAAAIIVI